MAIKVIPAGGIGICFLSATEFMPKESTIDKHNRSRFGEKI